jgi:hypothetical protein
MVDEIAVGERVFVLEHTALIEAIVRGGNLMGVIPGDLMFCWEGGKLEQASNGCILRLRVRTIGPQASAARLGASTETPESLYHLLGCVLSENERPSLKTIREWSVLEQLQVAEWAKIEHAHQAPINGHPLPNRLPIPPALAKKNGHTNMVAPRAPRKKPGPKPGKKKKRATGAVPAAEGAAEPVGDWVENSPL